jgi:transposase
VSDGRAHAAWSAKEVFSDNRLAVMYRPGYLRSRRAAESGAKHWAVENGMWNRKRDAQLVKLKRQGFSFAEIGKRMGVTRNAALGRFQRINRKKFPSQQAKRNARLRAQWKRKRERLRQQRDKAILKFRKDLAAGVPRLRAIARALKGKATGSMIAFELGLSPGRVFTLARDAREKHSR